MNANAKEVQRMLYTIDEAVIATGLSRRTIERCMADGRLKVVRKFGKPYIPHDELVASDPAEIETKPHVYFVKCGEFVKIDYSSGVNNRVKGIETGNPFDVELLYCERGNRVRERSYHARFASYRHRGEWFYYEGELKAWVEEKIAETQEPA